MSASIPVMSRLSARVLRVLGCNPGPMTLQGTNTYIIGTGTRRILLDTGESDKPEYISALSETLGSHGVRIERVLLTHWHRDHVGGAAAIASRKDLTIEGCTFHKFPRTDVEKEDGYGVSCISLRDGEQFTTEGATLKVVFTPGHTVDHAAFWLEEEGALFTGDCVLGEGTTVLETLSDYMRSLRLMLGMGASVLYPGHGPHVTDAQAHISGYISHRERREEQVLQCLRETEGGVSEEHVVSTVYKGLSEVLVPAALVNVRQHLAKLLEEGRVLRQADRWRLASQPGKL